MPTVSIPDHFCKPLEDMPAPIRPHGTFGFLGAQDKEQLDRIEGILQTLVKLIQEVNIERK
jgi:2'-5' RNA ligase